jgi:GTP cyclohydrolase II
MHDQLRGQTPGASDFRVNKVAEAALPSVFGEFRIYGFEGISSGRREEAVALELGDLSGPPPLVRVHSQCLTGDVFHSLRCDCRDQLDLALTMMSEEGRGLLIYENQEGRGIGLLNKLRAYELQDHGADTVEANEILGFKADLRSFELPGAILNFFGLKQIRLLSNNPEKVESVERAGVEVIERVPCVADAMESRTAYMATKKAKLGHLFDTV